MLKLLESAEERANKLATDLSDPKIISDHRKFTKLSREHKDLTEIVEVGARYRKLLKAIEEARQLREESDDPEMLELARQEQEESESAAEDTENELKLLLTPRDPNDSRDVIMEIRAGTGGEEAGLFGGDLYRMYRKYAEEHGFKVEVLNTNATGVGGFKEIIISISGSDAYSLLKFESGVHRVQRVPVTESSGRIHTSAASVAVLPEADEVDVQIDPNEIRVDVYRSSGPGGQSVNTTDSAVRITHLPTGIVVSCQDEKSQLKNKNKAMKVLRARLLDKAQEEQAAEIASVRKLMVGSGDRSAKIRTYNFPQGRVTDHRINLTLYKLDAILAGELDELIGALQNHEQEERLREFGDLAEAK
ncbi:MAG: peptide chain release factor 1 [bacterium]